MYLKKPSSWSCRLRNHERKGNTHASKLTDRLGPHFLAIFLNNTVRDTERDGVSNHQPHDCLLNRLIRRRSKETPNSGFCAGNSPVTGEFPHKGPVTRKMFPFDDVIINCAAMNRAGVVITCCNFTSNASHNMCTDCYPTWFCCGSWLIEAEWGIYASVNWPPLFQTMVCHLVGARPLYKPMLEYC